MASAIDWRFLPPRLLFTEYDQTITPLPSTSWTDVFAWSEFAQLPKMHFTTLVLVASLCSSTFAAFRVSVAVSDFWTTLAGTF